jgi:hypothetical protein
VRSQLSLPGPVPTCPNLAPAGKVVCYDAAPNRGKSIRLRSKAGPERSFRCMILPWLRYRSFLRRRPDDTHIRGIRNSSCREWRRCRRTYTCGLPRIHMFLDTHRSRHIGRVGMCCNRWGEAGRSAQHSHDGPHRHHLRRWRLQCSQLPIRTGPSAPGAGCGRMPSCGRVSQIADRP